MSNQQLTGRHPVIQRIGLAVAVLATFGLAYAAAYALGMQIGAWTR